MKSLTETTGKILSDPALREIYYEQVMTQRGSSPTVREGVEEAKDNALADARATAPDIAERRKALWQRLGYTPGVEADPQSTMPAAEAWMREHPEEINSQTAPTVEALQQVVITERARLKAARERLNSLGIR